MNRHSEAGGQFPSRHWLTGTVRRNPEALLLLAAGCVLLMRSAGRPSPGPAMRSQSPGSGADHPPGAGPRAQGDLSRAAERATDYARTLTDSAYDAASSYAGRVSELAEGAREHIAEQSDRLKRQTQATWQSGLDRVLRDQPLAVAVAGLAAGAAVAAAFPATGLEQRTLGAAHEALNEAAGKVGHTLTQAAGKVGEHLKSAAEERGLTSAGLKELAGEVADAFTDSVSAKPEAAQAAPAGQAGSALEPLGSAVGSRSGASDERS
jgi:hypothetical protein